MSDSLTPVGLQLFPDATLPPGDSDYFAIQQGASPLAKIAFAAMRSAVLGGGTVTPGTYTKVQVNSNGLVVLGLQLDEADIEAALGFTPISTTVLAQPNGVATLDSTGVLASAQIPPSLLSGLSPQGPWNAATNTPTLASGVGTSGHFYIVSVAGNTNLDGITTWNIGDWALFSGGVWTRVPSAQVLGTMSTQDANAVAITGGTLSTVTINSSTIANAVISTPTITGGSSSGQAIDSATITGSSATGLALTAPITTGGTSTGETLNSAVVISPAITLGTADGIDLSNVTIATATATGLAISSSTITGGAIVNAAISGGTATAVSISGGTASALNLISPAISNGTAAGLVLTTSTLSGVIGTASLTGTLSGGVISASTLSGTTTLSGTLAGGTLSSPRLVGTITNNGTLFGGNFGGLITVVGTINSGTFMGTQTLTGLLKSGTIDSTTTVNVLVPGSTTARSLQDRFGQFIELKDYGAKPDFQTLAGTISASGTSVTITGHTFTAADAGKILILPAGADDGSGNSIPGMFHTTGGSGSTLSISETISHAFTSVVGVLNTNVGPSIVSPGTGGTHVGDRMVVNGGTSVTTADLAVLQVQALLGTIVNTGSGGPTSSLVYLKMPVGNGSEPTFTGTTDSSGALTGTLTLTGGGSLYIDPADPSALPLVGYQDAVDVNVTFATGASWLVISKTAAAVIGHITVGADVRGGGLANGTQVLASVASPSTSLTGAIAGGTTLTASAVTGTLEVGSPIFGTNVATGAVITALGTGTGGAGTYQIFPSQADVSAEAMTAGGNTVQLSQVTIGAQTNETATFTTNFAPINFTATWVANSSTIIATGTATPTGLAVGQALYSGTAGLPGNRNPTDASANFITAISGTTITIGPSLTSTNNPTPATVQAIPFLSGATAAIAFGPSELAVNKTGAFTVNASGTIAVGTTGVTVTLGSAFTAYAELFTDNTTAINNWLAAVRTAASAGQNPNLNLAGVRASAAPGSYGMIGSINAGGMQSTALEIDTAGAVFYCANTGVNGGIAWDCFGNRFFRWNMLSVRGEHFFPPWIGIATGRYTNDGGGTNMDYVDCAAQGRFGLFGIYTRNLESSEFERPRVNNTMPPPTFRPANGAGQVPSFGFGADGLNVFGITSIYYPSTLTPLSNSHSFNQLKLVKGNITATGGFPLFLSGVTGFQMESTYTPTLSGAAVMIFTGLNTGGGGSLGIKLDWALETSTAGVGIQDTILLVGTNGNSNLTQFTLEMQDNEAVNSIVARDALGILYHAMTTFSFFDWRVRIAGDEATAVMFDRRESLAGLTYTGEFDSGTGALMQTQLVWNGPSNGVTARIGLEQYQITAKWDFISATNATFGGLTLTGDLGSAGAGGFNSITVREGSGTPGRVVLTSTGRIDLGQIGLAGFPSTIVPDLRFFENGNTSATAGHQFTGRTLGQLNIEGWGGIADAPGSANVHNFGLFTSNSFGQPSVKQPGTALTNGSTLTLTATSSGGSLSVPGAITVNVGTGTIAGLTLDLTGSFPDGYIQNLDCTGTITTLTLVTDVGTIFLNAPASLAKGTTAKLKLHKEYSTPAWQPA